MGRRSGGCRRGESAYLNRSVTDPATAQARQLEGIAQVSLVIREDQSRRDPMKVAQYEVLGGLFQAAPVPKGR
jgi:hypothetical protein